MNSVPTSLPIHPKKLIIMQYSRKIIAMLQFYL